MSRIVCLFSCGAASAVATKLAIARRPDAELVIYNNHIVEEHPDNERFLRDCERWFDRPVEVAQNEDYGGSIYEVFRRNRFLKGRTGAPCTKKLKREMREKFMRPDDLVVIGFTAEEGGRLDRFIDANNGMRVWPILIESNLTKADCLGIIQRAGIELPAMYKLGYANNNCRGCVKGGQGYWNKIRRDFPEYFERMAKMQDLLGPGSYFWAGADKKRISLRELPPHAGKYEDEPEISCGIVCELVEIETREPDSASSIEVL